MSYNSHKHGNKSKKIINNLALQCSLIEHYHIYTLLKQAIKAELIEKDRQNSNKKKENPGSAQEFRK